MSSSSSSIETASLHDIVIKRKGLSEFESEKCYMLESRLIWSTYQS